jgi:hypothetical protein
MSRPQGHSATGRITSLKKSSENIGTYFYITFFKSLDHEHRLQLHVNCDKPVVFPDSPFPSQSTHFIATLIVLALSCIKPTPLPSSSTALWTDRQLLPVNLLPCRKLTAIINHVWHPLSKTGPSNRNKTRKNWSYCILKNAFSMTHVLYIMYIIYILH